MGDQIASSCCGRCGGVSMWLDSGFSSHIYSQEPLLKHQIGNSILPARCQILPHPKRMPDMPHELPIQVRPPNINRLRSQDPEIRMIGLPKTQRRINDLLLKLLENSDV